MALGPYPMHEGLEGGPGFGRAEKPGSRPIAQGRKKGKEITEHLEGIE